MNKCISAFNLFITLGGHCTYFRRIDHNLCYFDFHGCVCSCSKSQTVVAITDINAQELNNCIKDLSMFKVKNEL
ncbi:hypothetical protein CCE14_04220 [Escherichia coli]|nr:hypothetical protein CCE14_04220 [Escherichia coli]